MQWRTRSGIVATKQFPRWPDDPGRPRVLVECDNASVQDGVIRALSESGYTVAACGGPETRASHVCPLVTDGRCGLVEDADIVVHMLDMTETDNRLVLYAIRKRVPETPIVIEASLPGAAHDGDVVAGCEQIRYPVTRQALLDAVANATTR
jgi:hypothetical protein